MANGTQKEHLQTIKCGRLSLVCLWTVVVCASYHPCQLALTAAEVNINMKNVKLNHFFKYSE